ncbi:uncharacterized protein LOC129615482 [Condylostylus longicornis]|uniref:uncharacterized protein LOC129615482 n=1 Tax=Condylostylus longicornis TaxID=2530218 RepID=UPI00244DE0B6|nr:uncharacterized protein LOC129615482 [Condylostylus longicornis]
MCNTTALSTIRTDIIRNNNLNNINNNINHNNVASINSEHIAVDVIESAPTIMVKPSAQKTKNENNNMRDIIEKAIKIQENVDDSNDIKTTNINEKCTTGGLITSPYKGVTINTKEMEIIPQGKHFRLVDDSELPEIMNILGRYLPESLKFHETIKTYLNDRVWQFYFYVSNKWPEEPICLHFPGCTLTPNNNIYESIAIFCPTSHIQCIDLLEDENLIDWKKPLYLNYTHKEIMERVDLFYKKKGTMDLLGGDIYVFKNINSISTEDLPSNEVEMRALTVDNVKTIHDLYPASEIECVEVFEKLVQTLPGVGIFVKNTDELVAWMVHSYYGAMFSMQTKPEFRRKGYGIHLARSLTQLVIKRGYSPFVIIRPENDASRNLYIKLGFEKVYETVRAKLNPFIVADNGDDGDGEHNCKNNRDLKNDDNINEIFEKKCKVNEE